MADPLETALTITLTIGGWIVATLVTVWSVRSAHRKELEAQRAYDDTVGLFRPLRKEMESLLPEERQVSWGGFVWGPSDEYRDIRHRGLLQPSRHDALRRDIEELERLHGEHATEHSKFYDARTRANRLVLEKADVDLSGGGKTPILSLLQVGPEHHELHAALAKEGAEWIEALSRLQRDANNRGGATKSADWRTMKPAAEEMLTEARTVTHPARLEYQKSAEALLSQARKIRDDLDRAIRGSG